MRPISEDEGKKTRREIQESFLVFWLISFWRIMCRGTDLIESLTLEDESLGLGGQLRLLSACLLELKDRGLGANLDLELISA